MLLAAGRLDDFRSCYAQVGNVPKEGLRIDSDTAKLLEVSVGDQVVAVSRNGTH
jgi:arginine/ornithine N-succinyltransferase beta subunit